MSSYPLWIITYDRGSHWDDATKKNPFHWAFLLNTTTTDGLIFQLRGMPGAFYYTAEEKPGLDEPGPRTMDLEIGAVPVSAYDRFKSILAAVPIVNVEAEEWNCQNWCLEALGALRKEGWVEEGLEGEEVRHWLREDK